MRNLRALLPRYAAARKSVPVRTLHMAPVPAVILTRYPSAEDPAENLSDRKILRPSVISGPNVPVYVIDEGRVFVRSKDRIMPMWSGNMTSGMGPGRDTGRL